MDKNEKGDDKCAEYLKWLYWNRRAQSDAIVERIFVLGLVAALCIWLPICVCLCCCR